MIRRQDPSAEGPLRPQDLRQVAAPLRVDRLRRYLRSGRADRAAAAHDLDGWIALFEANDEAPLLVLILELIGEVDDPRVRELAVRGSRHPRDGVRLESLRILLDGLPAGEIADLAGRFRDDRSLEVRLLVADRLMALDRAAAIQLALEVLAGESGGPREHHALERVTELLVDAGAREAVPRLMALADQLDDPEAFIPWALQALERAGD